MISPSHAYMSLYPCCVFTLVYVLSLSLSIALTQHHTGEEALFHHSVLSSTTITTSMETHIHTHTLTLEKRIAMTAAIKNVLSPNSDNTVMKSDCAAPEFTNCIARPSPPLISSLLPFPRLPPSHSHTHTHHYRVHSLSHVLTRAQSHTQPLSLSRIHSLSLSQDDGLTNRHHSLAGF